MFLAFWGTFLLYPVIFGVPVLKMIPSVEDYFPDLEGNLTKIEWLHAVNSQSRLAEGLTSEVVQMLEADVIFGHLMDGSGPMPVMGHPPATISNLSLQQFIDAVIDIQKYRKKGIKLDFKSDDAYDKSWKILDLLKKKLTFPVWLNADILPGPGNPSSVPLTASYFVSLAQDHLDEAPLSLGWTTAYKDGLQYTAEMLQAMLNLVDSSGVKQPITLAVRAAFAALSENGIVQLVNDINEKQGKNQTTITVWMSSATDKVDIDRLRNLMKQLGYSKVALDVPEDIRDQLLNGIGKSAATVVEVSVGVDPLSAVSFKVKANGQQQSEGLINSERPSIHFRG